MLQKDFVSRQVRFHSSRTSFNNLSTEELLEKLKTDEGRAELLTLFARSTEATRALKSNTAPENLPAPARRLLANLQSGNVQSQRAWLASMGSFLNAVRPAGKAEAFRNVMGGSYYDTSIVISSVPAAMQRVTAMRRGDGQVEVSHNSVWRQYALRVVFWRQKAEREARRDGHEIDQTEETKWINMPHRRRVFFRTPGHQRRPRERSAEASCSQVAILGGSKKAFA